MRARGVGLTVRCPDDVPPIEVDERRLTQALYNVVSNAVAFTPEGGEVLLSVQDLGDVVAVHIKDTKKVFLMNTHILIICVMLLAMVKIS